MSASVPNECARDTQYLMIASIRPFTIQATALLVTMLMGVHACLVMLFNIPPNYLSVHLGSFDVAYMNPYFEQSWSLFAPSPGDFNTDVLIRYAVRNGKSYRYTPWIDGNSMFPRMLAANPFSPLGLEREIYFSETLITTNDIIAARRFARLHPAAKPEAAVSMSVVPDFIAVDERFFMSLEPLLAHDASERPDFAVELTLHEIPNDRFGKRFGVGTEDVGRRGDAALRLPWVTGVTVPSFVSEAVLE